MCDSSATETLFFSSPRYFIHERREDRSLFEETRPNFPSSDARRRRAPHPEETWSRALGDVKITSISLRRDRNPLASARSRDRDDTTRGGGLRRNRNSSNVTTRNGNVAKGASAAESRVSIHSRVRRCDTRPCAASPSRCSCGAAAADTASTEL